jgi:hypothetical protein
VLAPRKTLRSNEVPQFSLPIFASHPTPPVDLQHNITPQNEV